MRFRTYKNTDLTVSEVENFELYTTIIRDITRRKELEREVVEIATLEQHTTQISPETKQRLKDSVHFDIQEIIDAVK